MQTYYIYLPFVPEVVTVKRGTHWKCFMLSLPPNRHRHRKNGVYAHTKCFRYKIQKKIYAFTFNVCVDDVYLYIVYIILKNPIECRNTRPRKIGCPMKIYAVGVPVCLWACESHNIFIHASVIIKYCRHLSYHKPILGNTIVCT